MTDFAESQKKDLPIKLQIYTTNLFSSNKKRALARRMISEVRKSFNFTTSEELIKEWPDSAPDLNPKTILGISTTHETGASVVRDQKILSAISEERLTRKKLDTKYPPVGAIREAVRMANIEPADIEAVAIGG
ncbi:MAG: hypothetical protein GWN16_11355, partial [Calditrichae bacterium]|nr:hypothetical protein [Calditrichia bacterium]